jgi:arabinofuranosyltransferase
VLAAALAARGSKLARAHVLGLALGTSYLVCIGGDFMSGRFCGPLLVLALAASVHERLLPLERPSWLVPVCSALVIAYALLWPGSPWHSSFERGPGPRMQETVGSSGIADERAFFYRSTGLLHMLIDRPSIHAAGLPLPPHAWAREGQDFARSNWAISAVGPIGFYGYFAGDKHVVDLLALADPFLARIPECTQATFRTGHCRRPLPDGYLKSLQTGRNLLVDPKLARTYAMVESVATGPLFTAERWQAILCLNLGVC